jgi:NADH-ubiquinone oxidoreductase chain 2
MQYIITNINAFFIIIAIGYSLYLYYTNISEYNNLSEKNNSPIQLISQLKGYFSFNPFLALCLIITLFSFMGLPPLMGFFGKQMVLTTALDNEKIILVIVGILTSVIGAVYYLSIVKTIYFSDTDYITTYKLQSVSLSASLTIFISISTIITISFIMMANEPFNFLNLLTSFYADRLS